MRRLQNLKKYPTFFWSQNSRNDFFKFLWPSQNIWPLTRPETPWLNLLIACSQNLLDFFTNTVTPVTYMIIFSPHNKSWHRKAPDAPLWNESWFFMFSGSEDHQTSFRLCSFIFLFWYSRSITRSWVTYVCASLYKSFQIIFWGSIQYFSFWFTCVFTKDDFMYQIWVKPTFCPKIAQSLLIWIWIFAAIGHHSDLVCTRNCL